MLHPDPTQRLTAAECLGHPFFWTDAQRLAFLADASDLLEAQPDQSPLRLLVEGHAASVVSSNWETRLDADLLDTLGKYRKYDYGSLCDCLRVIRNKKHHFRDLPPDVQAKLGPLPSGFVAYFLAPHRFPRLLLFLWHVLSAHHQPASSSSSSSASSSSSSSRPHQHGHPPQPHHGHSHHHHHHHHEVEDAMERHVGSVSARTRQRLRDALQLQHRPWWPPFTL
jgi:hypothetical protein